MLNRIEIKYICKRFVSDRNMVLYIDLCASGSIPIEEGGSIFIINSAIGFEADPFSAKFSDAMQDCISKSDIVPCIKKYIAEALKLDLSWYCTIHVYDEEIYNELKILELLI